MRVRVFTVDFGLSVIFRGGSTKVINMAICAGNLAILTNGL